MNVPFSLPLPGVVGVCWDRFRGRWNANIGLDGLTRNLGYFECKEAAIAARCKAERNYFGDFATQVALYAGGQL